MRIIYPLHKIITTSSVNCTHTLTASQCQNACGATGHCYGEIAPDTVYECVCQPGYISPSSLASKACICDICKPLNGGCSHNCKVTGQDRFECSCNEGYALQSDDATCTAIDNCAESNGGCSDICLYTYPGANVCACNSGGSLSHDGKTCVYRNAVEATDPPVQEVIDIEPFDTQPEISEPAVVIQEHAPVIEQTDGMFVISESLLNTNLHNSSLYNRLEHSCTSIIRQ